MKSRICKVCGCEFEPLASGQRYCSEACMKKGKSKTEVRKCYVCGDDFTVQYSSTAQRCPACRSRKGVSHIEGGTKKTRKCKFTPTNDNTPDGAKKEDMWLGEISEPQPKPVKAMPKGRKLPKVPYPPAHVRERPLHVPNVRSYNLPQKHSRCAYTPEQDEIIRVMYDEGASWDEIGEEFGRTGDAVRRHAQIIFGGTLMRKRNDKSM